jgi:hypothetical protein
MKYTNFFFECTLFEIHSDFVKSCSNDVMNFTLFVEGIGVQSLKVFFSLSLCKWLTSASDKPFDEAPHRFSKTRRSGEAMSGIKDRKNCIRRPV